MASFGGYLFKATKTNEKFPNKYIEYETWTSTPNQREELKAYRDDNSRNLTRVTASGKKSTFSFTVKPNLHLADKKTIMSFFYNGESDHTQRKIELQFWDDENSEYKTGTFYRPNMEFPIKKITSDDIIYKELKLEFIEY